MVDGNFVVFCENSFICNLKANKVKYIKVYIFRREITQGIYLNSQILAKDCNFEKLLKIEFLAPKFLNKGKKKWQKFRKICQNHFNTYIERMFSHFFDQFFIFEKIGQKGLKNHFLTKCERVRRRRKTSAIAPTSSKFLTLNSCKAHTIWGYSVLVCDTD